MLDASRNIMARVLFAGLVCHNHNVGSFSTHLLFPSLLQRPTQYIHTRALLLPSLSLTYTCFFPSLSHPICPQIYETRVKNKEKRRKKITDKPKEDEGKQRKKEKEKERKEPSRLY